MKNAKKSHNKSHEIIVNSVKKSHSGTKLSASLLCATILSICSTDALAVNVTGTWSGTNYQTQGSTTYKWALNLTQTSATTFIGTGTYYKSSGAWANYSLSGTISGNNITYTENSILSQGGSYAGWCFTSGSGTISANGSSMSGTWDGLPSSCSSLHGTFNMGSSNGMGMGNPHCSYAGQRTGGTDPINLGSGNLFEEILDYQSNGNNPLLFKRYYNSDDAAGAIISPLGAHWSSTYDRYISVISPTEVQVQREDGSIYYFKYSSSTWKTSTNLNVKLTQTGSGVGSTWVFTDQNSNVENYNQGSATQASLTSIVDLNNYTRTLTYTSGKLTNVTDSMGRSLVFTYNGNNRLATVTAPGGLVITFAYNNGVGTGDRLLSATYNTSPASSQIYAYTQSGWPFALTSMTDENGDVYKTWTYDAATGRALSSKLGAATDQHTVNYNNTNNNRTVTNALGQQEIYEFMQSAGASCANTKITRTATSTVPGGETLFEYDQYGYLDKSTDWEGNITTYTNNSRGLQTSRTEGDGSPQERTITTTWHATLNLPTRIVQTGLTTDFTYDTDGNMLTKKETDKQTQTVPYSTNGATRTWTWTYDTFGNVLTQDGPRTDVLDLTTYTYTSPAKNLNTVTNALNQVTTFTNYDASGRPLSFTDPNGVVTNLLYDIRGRLKTQTVVASSGNAVTSYGYDDAGLLTSVTLPNGSVLNYIYDTAHNLTAITNGLGERIDFTLNAAGNVTLKTIKNTGATIRYQQSSVYDSLSRLLNTIGYLGAQTSTYAYDANGNQISFRNASNNTTTYAFDALNRLAMVTDALSKNASTGYDKRDNVTSQSDYKNIVTSYVYNGFNQLIQSSSPDTGTTIYTLDKAGNRISETDARGVITNRTFDALNRVTSETFPAATGENIAYTYDATTGGNKGIGRLTGFTDETGSTSLKYDERGNVLQRISVVVGKTYTTSYTYNPADQVTLMTYPSGRQLQFLYDSNGDLTTINTRPNAGGTYVALVSAITREPFGPIKSYTLGNGITVNRNYNKNYWLTSLGMQNGGTTLQNLALDYDNAGFLKLSTDWVNTNRTQTFTLDALKRLTQSVGAYGTVTYTYDDNSNRATISDGTTTETYNYTAGTNRLANITGGTIGTRAFTYSASGNTATDDRGSADNLVFNWSKRDRLASVNAGWSVAGTYLYNAQGERASRVVGAYNIHYVYDESGQLISELNGATGALTRDYVWLENIPLAQFESSGAVYYPMPDQTGTPLKLTDATKAVVYDRQQEPYGETYTTTTGMNSQLRFTGQIRDAEVGLHYNYFRDYDPTTGRYVETDPIGLQGGLNRYGYVGGNPIQWTDPTGTVPLALPVICAGGGCEAAAGAVAAGIIATYPPTKQAILNAGGKLAEICSDTFFNKKAPANAHDPNGPKAPGKPGAAEGFEDPKGGENWVKNPNGKGYGWQDVNGDVWIPTGQAGTAGTGTTGSAHGGPHWDVQSSRGNKARNVYPGGKIR